MVATRAIRIELRGLADERAAAQRDLEDTLVALEEKLRPSHAAHRLVEEHSQTIVLAGAAALGLALGLAHADTRGGRATGLAAAAVAGAIAYRLSR